MKIKELYVKGKIYNLQKPKYMKLYISNPEDIESLVINGKEYKITEIIKKLGSD